MTTPAIYTVRQHGMESHFYSYCAGGFSYPFHVGEWLSRLDTDVNSNRPEGEKLSVAALLPQFTGDYHFPEAAKGLHLFREVSDSGAADWLGRTPPTRESRFTLPSTWTEGRWGLCLTGAARKQTYRIWSCPSTETTGNLAARCSRNVPRVRCAIRK